MGGSIRVRKCDSSLDRHHRDVCATEPRSGGDVEEVEAKKYDDDVQLDEHTTHRESYSPLRSSILYIIVHDLGYGRRYNGDCAVTFDGQCSGPRRGEEALEDAARSYLTREIDAKATQISTSPAASSPVPTRASTPPQGFGRST